MVPRASTDVPDKLYNPEIRQYETNGDYITGTGATYATVDVGTHLNVSLKEREDCQLVIVARGSGAAVGALGSQSLDDVQKKVVVNSSVINAIDPNQANAMNAMPYVLHLKNVKVATVNGVAVIQSKERSYDTRLLLKRLAARLTVTWHYKVTDYTMRQVLIQSVPLDYAVVDKSEKDGSYPELVSQFTSLVVPDVKNEGSYSCWVPTNVRGENGAATSDLLRIKDNAPTGSFYISFIAVNNKVDKEKLNYRVYIGSGSSKDFNLYRNKDYNYEVNFDHTGIPLSDRRVTYINPVSAADNNDNFVPTANCFMVAPGGAFCFDPFAFRQGNTDILNQQLADWCTNGIGIQSVELLWQIKENGDLGEATMGVANSDKDHTNIVDIRNADGTAFTGPATGRNQCRIYCRVAANTTGGGGVIAARDGSGNILWSWHVWVTDYNPDATGAFTVLEPENKRKFKLGSSSTMMMDRNLGAYEGAITVPKETLDKSRVSGFHYQKGRKDPFPSSYTTEEIEEVYKFTLSATSPPKHIMNRYEANGIYAIVPAKINGSDAAVSLQDAYRHPVDIAGSTSIGGASHWCKEYTKAIWATTKTVHDPCPAGWRIPQKSDAQILIDYNSGKIPADAAATNGGALLKYDETDNRTYLRFTGYPPNITQLNNVGRTGYMSVMDLRTAMGVTNNSITMGRMEDYDAHTTRRVQENN
ncbi:MAG: fibrobacter succinogenes major paralogous domain-containing protein [Bacteroides sp.]|nr:fibrobacter succinogenes major paralogous domain-containing protein [Bacteroides sp.]